MVILALFRMAKDCMTAAEAGDEAFMLAKHLPKVPVLIGAERAVTGRYNR